ASIIASFKLYYHYLQLQHAINHDKASERDVYKVNQLQILKSIGQLVGQVGANRFKISTIVEAKN
ncbi:4133_t:CDS:1, partial [Racocetra persica]